MARILTIKWWTSLFVWFDSLRPINNLSVKQGRVFLGWTSTKLGLMFLLKDTTQWGRWGWNLRPSVTSQVLYHWATALAMNQLIPTIHYRRYCHVVWKSMYCCKISLPIRIYIMCHHVCRFQSDTNVTLIPMLSGVGLHCPEYQGRRRHLIIIG